MSTPAHLAVGLLKKPHGVRGDALIVALTDAPEVVFTAGRALHVLDRSGRIAGSDVVVQKARAYHRAWLVHFEGMNERDDLEALRGRFLAVAADEARPLAQGEFRMHELIGLAVMLKDKSPVGTIVEVYEAPQGWLLGVKNGDGKEHLVPFTPDVVRRVDRAEKRVTITPPEGLLEL